ncbi:FMRFamide receptor [Orchesella cincta]|uniref:FMRFamide receptor n=1 Tax=Orchesella cincta TaxID=48709 RepID=A0A1D2MHV8_ORCCI|nr:FMRFamide receptor [Orchesella cincta]
MNCTDYTTDEYLPEIFTCQIIDLSEHKLCSEHKPNVCIRCSILGKFFTGESIYETKAIGHVICVFLWSLTVIVGVHGVATNFLIVIITRRINSQRPFDILIMFLAMFDLLCSGSTVVGMTVHVAFYQSWVNKNFWTMHWFHKSTLAILLCRTASTYMAMLITMERFLVLKFPFQTRYWFSTRKTILLAIGVIVVSLILNVPRFLMFEVEPNHFQSANITALHDFTYIVGVTHIFGWNTICFFFENLWDMNEHLDFLAPLPVLLVFNVLSYAKVQKMQNRRKQLDMGVKAEIETVRLFLPVVIAYFSTNVVPFVHFFIAYFTDTFYRELNAAVGLSIAINSAVNFQIYYYQRKAFRMETKAFIPKWYKFVSVFRPNEAMLHRDNTVDTGTETRSTDSALLTNKNTFKSWVNWKAESGVEIS